MSKDRYSYIARASAVVAVASALFSTWFPIYTASLGAVAIFAGVVAAVNYLVLRPGSGAKGGAAEDASERESAVATRPAVEVMPYVVDVCGVKIGADDRVVPPGEVLKVSVVQEYGRHVFRKSAEEEQRDVSEFSLYLFGSESSVSRKGQFYKAKTAGSFRKLKAHIQASRSTDVPPQSDADEAYAKAVTLH